MAIFREHSLLTRLGLLLMVFGVLLLLIRVGVSVFDIQAGRGGIITFSGGFFALLGFALLTRSRTKP